MLFYNHNQEFIGIDEESLKLLNYTTLEDLLQVCSDVADLFAKEPGYIHNFKSFGWIDFLLHADSDARSAIVHGNGRTFSCTLQVKSLFLSADPSSPGYIIDMLHIQSLSEDDVKPQIFAKKAKPEIKPPLFETQPIETAPSILPNYDHIIPTPLSEPGVLDVPSYNEQDIEEEPIEDLYAKLSLPLNEEELEKDYFVPEPSLSFEPEPEPILNRPMFEDVRYSSAEKEFINTLKVDSSYLFDPNVAAQELGLPVDLIQEFIGDFIQQANEFKEELFEAALRGDMNNLKILSHKLKGVAANLRIEDAFETLNIINTSNDPTEIEANLKYFYNIISKLEGKEVAKEKSNEDIGNDLLYPLEEPIFLSEDESVFPPLPSNDDDIYTFDTKDDNTPLLLQEEDLYSTPLRDEDIISSPYEEDIPLFEENFSEKSIETEPSEPVHSDDIYTFDLKDDNSPLLLQEEIPPVSYENESLIDTQPFEERVREESIPAEPMQSLHYDKTFIAGQLGIELDFFDELIDEYKLDALRAGNEISASISAFDTHAWKKPASQLKGISDNLRLNEISDELAILSQTNDAQEANKASKRLNSFLEQL